MSASDALAPLRPFVLNPLPAAAPWVAGVLGDHPSTYSRSPALWNAAFAALGLPARYVTFDVPPDGLEAFLAACRAARGLLGFSVTTPYKERVTAHLDRLLPEAAAVGAVNTVIRTPEGALLGTNTDGAAALETLRRLYGGASAGDGPTTLLLLGAGGAARAVGVAVARGMPGTAIVLCSRRPDRATGTAQLIGQAGSKVTMVSPDDLNRVLPGAGIVVNASSVGMAGPVRAADGVTWLEPFSPLAPADPPAVPADNGAVPPATWWEQAWPGIARNLEVSLRRALQLPPGAAVFDLIYAPPETVLLKHARWTGHAVMNGEAMLRTQAVEAFLRLCAAIMEERSLAKARPLVEQAMTEAVRGGGGECRLTS